jgi:large subunit ribosomal protein L1
MSDIKEKIEDVKAAVKEDIAEKVADAKEKATEVKETLESKAGEAKEALEDKADEVKETFAKAGKKSRKHLEEVKAEAERLERKAERKAEELAGEKPKGAAPKVRPLLERRGKKYQEAHKLVEKGKIYNLKDALELAIKTSPVKFDASVEVHARLGVDPRQADQNIRTTLVLPNGSGKDVRVAVFAPEDVCKVASAAGADIAEDAEFLKQPDKGEINFDILISVPAYMPKLGKYARMLGPKGLMPNPKAGTVTMDVERAVKEAKAGKVEYRVDKQGIVPLSVGKVSFGADKLYENASAFFDSLKAQKPASLKGTYVKSIFITTTMGPSIQIENLYN